jgi:hypothetical protein
LPTEAGKRRWALEVGITNRSLKRVSFFVPQWIQGVFRDDNGRA